MYSKAQAKRKAEEIFKSFGLRIYLACQNSIVKQEFLAGFIGVEAGVRDGKIVDDATRFEKGVYEDLISLRDKGYCYVAGKKRTKYNNVNRSDIADASDVAIRALSKSYGLTQIMGWHVINSLNCTINDLRNPAQHLFFTVELLLKDASGANYRAGELGDVLRIWNTGNENGKTYHEDYVDNALLVMKEYKEILEKNPNAFKNAPSSLSLSEKVGTIDEIDQTISAADDISVAPPEPSISTEKPASDPLPNPSEGFNSEQFQAYIPQIDTAKSWIKRATAATGTSTIIAFIYGLPMWVILSLIGLFIVIAIGTIIIFIKYHDKIFAYVTTMNTLRATEGTHNPVVSSETPKKDNGKFTFFRS